jgi:hypothetical protein
MCGGQEAESRIAIQTRLSSPSGDAAGQPQKTASIGRTISIPVWFVLDGEKLYLLPMQGSANNGSRTYFRTRRFGLMCELSKFDVAVVVELR